MARRAFSLSLDELGVAHRVTALVEHPEPTREPGVDPDHPPAVRRNRECPEGTLSSIS